MTRDDGTPVNAVYGFTNMLWKLLEDTDADHVAIALDEPETFDRKSTINTVYRPPPPEDRSSIRPGARSDRR